MKFKNISGLVALTLFLSSFNLPSFAGILSEDGRYEAFSGDKIRIDNLVEEGEVDAEVEGNTLVNLVQYSQGKLFSMSGDNRINRKIEGDCATYTTRDDTSSYITINTGAHSLIKPNTSYTIFFDVYENQIPNYNGLSIRGTNDAFFGDYEGNIYYDDNYILTKGRHKIVFTTHENISHYTGLGLGFKWIGSSAGSGLEFKIGNIMILEGGWSNRETPEYFTGIQSGFESNKTYSGDYNITLNAIDKNLAKDKWMPGFITAGEYGLPLGSYSMLGCEPNGYHPSDNRYRYCTNYIEIKPSNNYKLVNYIGGRTTFYDSNFNYISNVINETVSGNISTPSNAKYIRIHVDWLSSDINSVNVTLEEESGEVDYTQIQFRSTNIKIKEPLRAVNDTIKDRFVKINGQWYIERNCGEEVFDGSKAPHGIYGEGTNSNYTTVYFSSRIYNDNPKVVSDKFKTIPYAEVRDLGETEGVLGGTGAGGAIFFSIHNSRLTDSSVGSARDWFLANPTKVVYELREPVYEPLRINPSISLFEGTTHITNNSNVPANMKVTVDRAANRAIEAIETAKANPTSENISIARMWINLLDDSALKDSFQDIVGEITEVLDLTIDKKTVTANLDLYIKSNNSLTMSLSTNSVTFENYSGVEDLEMLDAVNITVNSSLPYSLNAYMPSLISNSDGSNTMDANILNIRDNSKSNYSQFINTTDKVVLKDDCEAGDNNIHNIDLKLSGNNLHKADVYKTVIKFEAEQK